MSSLPSEHTDSNTASSATVHMGAQDIKSFEDLPETEPPIETSSPHREEEYEEKLNVYLRDLIVQEADTVPTGPKGSGSWNIERPLYVRYPYLVLHTVPERTIFYIRLISNRTMSVIL